ncbi:hypothetical protein SEVIR_6G110200v4 [Setaria viridis]|uniref:DNA-directed RNA polymerase III subunit RPC5 n=1 Tax=Setaria viridis TaxID=4556 RepID=A0A4U6U597_SETVI|nr:uncharacterized protein LOC117860526 [Setaria viridis]TKW09555.1 hypothetical protein SEVIR_6G110200v2 [Setaria viridis]
MATGGDKPPSLDADVDMADLASLDAPAASSAAAAGVPSTRFRPKAKGKPKPKPEAPKPVPVAVPKPESEPEPMPEPASAAEPEPEAANAAPPEDDRVDAMEVDGAGDAAGVGERAEAEEEEEDFVVREIDVYYTPKPFDDDTKLYIMQYPLRPCWRPYELNEICEEVRVKPLSSEVEVDLSVDTQSENYDQEAPLRLTKQTLSSSKADDVSDYAIGVLKGNLVHLNHIDAVVQLRPSMSHVFSGRAYTRQALQSREMNGGASGSKASSRKGDEHPEDSKDHAEDSEPWISLTYQPTGSNISTKYHDKMISNEGGPIDFTMRNSDYVMSLCPGASTSSRHINKCQAIREMLLLPLEERLKKWFTEVSEVNQFDALKHLAPTYSEEEILKVLPEYAYLVRGLWVCKSSLLFDDGYASKRDRVLLEFTKMESIPSDTLDAWIRLDDPKRKRILFPLCKRRGILKDYKFISADLSFLKRYPHIVNEQECAWSAREMILHESPKMCSTVPRKGKNSTRPNVASKGPHPNTSKGRDGPAQGSDDLVQSVLGTVFTANKVRSMQAVVRDLRQLAAKYASNRKDVSKFQALSDAAKYCASLPHDKLKSSILLVAVDVHDVFVAKHENKLALRNVLILLFRKKEPNATLTKQEILAAAAKIIKREVTDREYHQVVTEICISTEDGHLVLKNGDEP